ncbi:MAG: hypothetical protein J7K08_02140 [Thermoplasmata archaeon]|nr:hypothetical protein [Thermoplasmata archaeon]
MLEMNQQEDMDPRRLKKAEKLYKKYYLKKYKKGKISREELRAVLSPYREELAYLGLIKGERKEERKPAEAPSVAPRAGEAAAVEVSSGVKEAIILSTPEMGPEDALPVEEIEKRVDALEEERLSRIRELYRQKYGEELELPEEIERRKRELWALREEVGEGERAPAPERVEGGPEVAEVRERKSFWSLTNFTLLSSGKSGVVRLVLLIVDIFLWVLLIIPRIIMFPVLYILRRRKR